LFRLGPVAAAVWLVSFDVVVLGTLRRSMACASSVHDGLDFLLLKFSYSVYISPSEIFCPAARRYENILEI
jgi:hypothetical protein